MIISSSNLFKKGHSLRKEIEPDAAIHQACDQARMEKAVLRLKDIIDGLPAGRVTEIQKDFQSVHELVTRVVDKDQAL